MGFISSESLIKWLVISCAFFPL